MLHFHKNLNCGTQIYVASKTSASQFTLCKICRVKDKKLTYGKGNSSIMTKVQLTEILYRYRRFYQVRNKSINRELMNYIAQMDEEYCFLSIHCIYTRQSNNITTITTFCCMLKKQSNILHLILPNVPVSFSHFCTFLFNSPPERNKV